MTDAPLHLSELSICKRSPYSEASVTVPIWVTQSSLDGLQSMIRVCEGLEASGHGKLSGSFEIVMFYRTLCDCIRKAEAAAKAATP